MFNERDSLISRHKITLDGLECDKNHSTNQVLQLHKAFYFV